MTPEEETLEAVRQLVEALPPEKKASVILCADAMRRLVKEAGPAGALALALVGAESAAA